MTLLPIAVRAGKQNALPLPKVRTGRAVLRQEDRVTRLELMLSDGSTARVALTHKGAYPQGRNAPFAARLIAEVPGKMLIFTDSFASNPGNVQGECGASTTGERYLHVVSLAPPQRETLSVQVEGCLSDMEPAHGSPLWDAARRTLTVRYARNEGGPSALAYKVAEDGSVNEDK